MKSAPTQACFDSYAGPLLSSSAGECSSLWGLVPESYLLGTFPQRDGKAAGRSRSSSEECADFVRGQITPHFLLQPDHHSAKALVAVFYLPQMRGAIAPLLTLPRQSFNLGGEVINSKAQLSDQRFGLFKREHMIVPLRHGRGLARCQCGRCSSGYALIRPLGGWSPPDPRVSYLRIGELPVPSCAESSRYGFWLPYDAARGFLVPTDCAMRLLKHYPS